MSFQSLNLELHTRTIVINVFYTICTGIYKQKLQLLIYCCAWSVLASFSEISLAICLYHVLFHRKLCSVGRVILGVTSSFTSHMHYTGFHISYLVYAFFVFE
jgi:hypothetical protein